MDGWMDGWMDGDTDVVTMKHALSKGIISNDLE